MKKVFAYNSNLTKLVGLILRYNFAQASQYSSEQGRFVSQDKVSGIIEAPFTLNAYSYCWNNPLNVVDLDGKFPIIPNPYVLIQTGTDLTTAPSVGVGIQKMRFHL